MGTLTRSNLLNEHEVQFSQWWGRWVMDLTDEEMAAGGAGRVAWHAAKTAWMASALTRTRRASDSRRTE